MAQVIGERRPHQLAGGRSRVGRIPGLAGLRAGRQIHAARQQIRRGHPVGERVVDLADHRDPVIGQALDEVHLPQRVIAVQRRAGDLADRLVELATTARRGHSPRPHVVGQVDVAVFPPHRVMQLERDVNELIAKRLQLVQPAVNDPAERVDVEVATVAIQLDHRDFEGVHMHIRCLAVQQHRIPAAQPFHLRTPRF